MRSAPRAILQRETEKKEGKASRRFALPSRGGKGGLQFIQDTYAELKKVVWPTRQQTVNLSVIVVAASLAVGGLLGLIDWLFSVIMQRFLIPGI